MSQPMPFKELGLSPLLLSSLKELGYETPTPIQEQSIPVLLKGHDLLAQAQTGTGKTAAFALPILTHLDMAVNSPQTLVITPTRELSIQVAEAFKRYAKNLKGFQVTPIYGGQDFRVQLRALKRGPQVIVGTPGRLMDHMRRKTLSAETFKHVILDEADEMLKMGFIEDIEWILSQIPNKHQTALFSATIPTSIKHIAKRYLKNEKRIHIEPKKNTINKIDQYFISVSNKEKLDVLTRFLEVEDIGAAIIFTRTKNSSIELAEKIQARGYAASALNGDMKQSFREKVIRQLKQGQIDFVIATDVAARGIDVSRITHVINYDIPHDVDAYTHRIGRTGRAGREGKALLFVTPREKQLLKDIERNINTKIKKLEPPSMNQIREIHKGRLADDVINTLQKNKKLNSYYKTIEDIIHDFDCDALDVAAALAYLIQASNSSKEPEIRPKKKEIKSHSNREPRHKKSFSNEKPRKKITTQKAKKTGGRKKIKK